ncbi:MAG: type II toxin-antitoxin system death-on-curing family toxin [Alphaproteobacteria bacterium PA3]|nr:MAG: type II toxin-antitoxin system death-on-curing family toxin [Alphaproteobacteria bacterium PA3]
MNSFVWLEEAETLIIHDRLLDLHGGASGVRDRGLLHSALSRPKQYASYADHVDVIFLAALYTTAIIRNHPFVDGNKRTGFVMGILFLELNGCRFFAPEDVSAQAALSLTEGKSDEVAFAQFLREFTTSI